MIIVPDANIVVKWYMPEQYSSEALHLFNITGKFIRAPAFLKTEFFSVVVKKIQLRLLSKEFADLILYHFNNRKDILYFQFHDELDTAYEIASEINHSLYDCLYIAVAQYVGGTVITADKKFYQQCVSHESYKKYIQRLSDFA